MLKVDLNDFDLGGRFARLGRLAKALLFDVLQLGFQLLELEETLVLTQGAMEGGLTGSISHEVFLGFLVSWGCIIHFNFALLARAWF